MKNITLSVDEKVLKRARAYAAKRGTTVNALVREHLAQIIREEEQWAEAKRGLKELMENPTGRLGPDYKWNREEIYAERLLPRHENSDLRRGREGQ
jgi:predicted transcriptional regulator